ncbi:pentapeptide repeat-containing protein [Lentzea sp. NPDC034063]|uniref:pentapeptide repeat-containing protein n=1 Tax=unclassified Lentzea TaxID=2643253 RepID=UPI0033D8B49C
MAVAVLLVSAAALVVLWVWIDSLRFADLDKRATAHLEAVKVASAIAVGGGGLFALYLAARRQRTQELELELRREELHGRDLDAAERRVTELYAKAADQLDSDKAPVRLAGLFGLDRLADDNPRHRQMVIDLVCAYLRMPHSSDDVKPDAEAEEREVRLAAQRMLAKRARPDLDPVTGVPRSLAWWSEIHEFNLSRARLIDFDLSGCRLGKADFTSATFVGTATFEKTEFRGETTFARAEFTGEVDFTAAVFLREASFERTGFRELAELDYARFQDHVDFFKTQWSSGAWFARARFDKSTEFGDALFAGACFFNGAAFHGPASFAATSFEGRADFDKAAFAQPASFDSAMFKFPVDLGTI